MVTERQAKIEGVRMITARGYSDPIGLMASAGYRASDAEWFKGYGDLLLMTLKEGGFRPFHYHKEGIDTVGVVAGTVRAVLYDLREESPSFGQVEEFDMSFDGKTVQFLQVPPMVAHAVKGLAGDAVMVDIATSEAQSGSDFFVADAASIPYQLG
jgi:dTDP-4-dehydrorhamnose 3,5-epimerase